MAGHDDAAESFWRFSLMVYARPGVAEALIRLQDRGGHNVNLILFGLWLGICEGLRLGAGQLARAETAIARLDSDIVMPLRRLRSALKGDPDPDVRALRRRVLALEIAAERRVQVRLAATITRRRTTRAGDREAIAEANLRLILGANFADEEAALILRAIALFVPRFR
jgi:uncharacterized protein (TIGR02444 family)